MPPRLDPACAEAATGTVPMSHRGCYGEVHRCWFGAIPSLCRGPTGAALGLCLVWSGLYCCSTGAVPGPCRGDTSQVHSACSETCTGLLRGGKHCCSELSRVCAGELSRGCTGAAPELYRGSTGAVLVNLHSCTLLVSVPVFFPFQRLSFCCWCAGALVVSAVVLVFNSGCPVALSAVVRRMFVRLPLC